MLGKHWSSLESWEMAQYNKFKRGIWLFCGWYLVDEQEQEQGNQLFGDFSTIREKSIYLVMWRYAFIKWYAICSNARGNMQDHLILWTYHDSSGHWSRGRQQEKQLSSWCLLFILWLLVYMTYQSHNFNMFSIIHYLLFIKYYRHWFPLEPILTQHLSW